jgi:hypothetical protein
LSTYALLAAWRGCEGGVEANVSGPDIEADPLRGRLSVMACAMSFIVLFAHADSIRVPEVTGFPAGRV